MNIFHQLCDRLQLHVQRYTCSHIEVDARNKQISAGFEHAAEVSQDAFRVDGVHMAQKPVRDYHVLAAQHGHQFRISGVRAVPRNAFLNPRFDPDVIAFAIKHLVLFTFKHPVDGRRSLISVSIPIQFLRFRYTHCRLNVRILERINALLGKLHDLLRDVDSTNVDGQIRSCSLERPRNGIDLGTLTASEDSYIHNGAVTGSGCQPPHEFEFCPISEKKRTVILSPICKPQNQGMQVSTICDKHRERAKGYREALPDATGHPQISSDKNLLKKMQGF